MTDVVLGPVAAMAALLVCIGLGLRRAPRPVPVRVDVRSGTPRRQQPSASRSQPASRL